MVLAGPIVCGMSQAANDWCDRHVDAVNEPRPPDPLGPDTGALGAVDRAGDDGAVAGGGLAAGALGLWRDRGRRLAAWAYSAEPVRLKRSGWWGPGLVGLSYEGLPWFTGAAVLLGSRAAVRES